MNAIRSALIVALFLAVPVAGSLKPKVTYSGNLKLSVDASGSNTGTATIRAEKPSVNATVHAAYFLAASTGFTYYTIKAGDIQLDGTPIAFTDALANSINSWNYWTDVSLNVRSKLNAAPAGIINLTVNELPSVTTNIDGEILVVIWEEPSAPPTTITLLFGAQSTGGDSFTVTLAAPVDKSNPATVLDMSLGISYGYQPAGQYSILSLGVNGTRISTSAGGYDDGQAENGALITAGGIGDLNDNPPDPYATDLTCRSAAGLSAPRCDDELYSLLPFVADGTTSFTVSTLNPSNDDNIFFAGIVLGANTGSVGEGILLSPAANTSPVNTSQVVNAKVQFTNGDPINGRQVAFRVISGPNAGMNGSISTDPNGNASFSYSSSIAGVDTIQACMINSNGVTQCSNEVSRTWSGTNAVTYTLTLNPSSAAKPVGTTDTFTALVQSSSGNPVSGAPVTFTVTSGPNTGLTSTSNTDTSGKAAYSYLSTLSGSDTLVASVPLGGVVQNSNTASQLWLAQTGNPIVSLGPVTAVNPVNGQVTLNATVADALSSAVAGATVYFTVLSGPNMGLIGSAVTDVYGAAKISYIDHKVGIDAVQASTTISSNPVNSNVVALSWTGLLCDLDNNGQVDNRDILSLFGARNTLALPGDPRDANFDGKIDALDLRVCTLMCAKTGCAQ